MTRFALVLLFGILQGGNAPAQLPSPAAATSSETRVFIVRHAEKDAKVTCPGGGTNCVPLTAAGEARASELARLLKNQPLKKIFSTEYKRVLDTARPSDRTPSVLVSVPAREQLKVIDEIAKEPGTYFIVTHSDMVVPFLRKLLNNEQLTITTGAMPNMANVMDDPDYDNLFLVTLGPGGGSPSCKLYYFGEKTAGDLVVTECPAQGRLR